MIHKLSKQLYEKENFTTKILGNRVVKKIVKHIASPSYKLHKTISQLQGLLIKYEGANLSFEQGKVFLHFRDIKFRYTPELALLALHNRFEEGPLDTFLKHVAYGQTVLDIGGNFGLYSLLLAKEKNAVVYTFEPVKDIADLLEENVKCNSLQQVFLVRKAVGDADGTVHITTDKFGQNHLSSQGKNTQRTPVTSIDSFVKKQSIKKIHAIKCDIEGAELLMLKGALKTLKRDSPIIMMEIEKHHCTRFGHSPQEIFALMISLNYKCKYVMRGSQVRKYSGSLEENLKKGNNFLFTR